MPISVDGTPPLNKEEELGASPNMGTFLTKRRSKMPCRSDYMEPNARERNWQQAAQFLVYALVKLGKEPPENLKKTANDIYAREDFTADLCHLLNNISDEAREKIIYDAHSRQARELANWWDDHKEADKRRKLEEMEAVRLAHLRMTARAKLTPEEMTALGIRERD